MVKSFGAGGWFLMALIVTLIAGCGSDLNTVTGTVTMDGEPLDGALVMFTPMTGGRPAAGRTNSQGQYELVYDRSSMGTITGEHFVSITTGDELTLEDGSLETVEETVPAQYNANSELRRTIEEGANVFDFELESGGEIVDVGQEESSADG